MKLCRIPKAAFSLVIFMALIWGGIAPTGEAGATGGTAPIITSGDLIHIQPSMLNADGTFNLSGGVNGALDLSGWDVALDSKRGPVFSPAAFPANTWSALADIWLNGPVLALAVIGSELYVGGFFDQFSGGAITGLNYIARYDTLTNTWSALTDNGLDVASVSSFAVIGNDLYIGGRFTQTFGGATTGLNHIAKYNTLTNTWSALTDNGLDNGVHTLAVIGSELYVGGYFTQTFGGATTGLNNIARYNTLTNTWSALTDNGLDEAYVAALAVIGKDLYIGGNFTQSFGGATTGLNHIAKYNTLTNTWSALTNNGLDSGVNAIALIGNDLYIGGYFTQTFGSATTGLNHIAKYDTLTNTWSALTDNGLDYFVDTLATIGDDLYVGGWFNQTAGGATTGLNSIAKYNTLTNTWSALRDNGLGYEISRVHSGVETLAAIGNDLYVGGWFSQTYSGETTGLRHIARYTLDTTSPTVISHSLAASYQTAGPSAFTVTFSENVNNPEGNTDKDDVTNPANYLIVNKGANKLVDTISCKLGPAGDDTKVIASGVSYVPNTAVVTFASPLPVGNYRLFVCGTTSIVDTAHNPLGGGVDFTFDFTVTATTTASSLPKTGFTPNNITSLPAQPTNLAYTNLGSIWLEIPSQNIKANIVGIPESGNTWDVNWLGWDVGWLNGTAFPTWEGNSVITGHVTNSNGLPGPFANLKDLNYGERIIVHLFDQQYIFEIRNKRLVRPETTAFAFEHLEGHSYLTLITCQSYDPTTDSYIFRRIIRAVLVSVK